MSLRRAFANGRHLTSGRLSIHSCAPLPTYRSQPRASFHSRPFGHAPVVTALRNNPSTLASTRNVHKEVEHFHQVVFAEGRPPRSTLVSLERQFDELREHSLLPEESTRDLLRDAMLRISRSTFPNDRMVLRRLLRATARLFHVEIAEYVSTVFDQTIAKDEVDTAADWLCATARMSELGSAFVLSLWHQLFHVVARRRNDHFISKSLKQMVELTIQPTPETAKVVITALLCSPSYTSPPPYEMMKHVIHLFAAADLAYDEELGQLILDFYTKADEASTGRRIQLLYLTALAKRGKTDETSMYEVLAFLSSQGDRKKVVRQYRHFRDLGLQPSDDALHAVISGTPTLANLTYWRRNLGLRGGPRSSTETIKHMVEVEGSFEKAIAFYKSECRSGIVPNPDMLHLAIHALLSRGLKKPSDVTVDAAVELYKEFVARHDSTPKSDLNAEIPGVYRFASSFADPPKACTYQLLLRALTATADVVKHLPTAVSLVEDMQRFRVGLDPQSTASFVVLLMRSSSTPEEAFQMYRLVGCPSDKDAKPVLNDEGYNAVLHTFCNLSSWPEGIPSAQLYFQIVADMRKYGLEPNAKAYTIILRQLATLATNTPPDSDTRDVVAKSITRVHNHLTVKSSFTPDAPLWNQLMDAYQRAGCFADAFRVWQQLFASRQFTNASVSIILDACAYAKAYDMAVRVYTSLAEIEYPMNLRNWNTFLECLCRLDRLDEAMKVLCLEMTGRDDGIAPDAESVRILLKFAAKKNREAEVLSKVKRFLPKLYFSLPEDLRPRYR